MVNADVLGARFDTRAEADVVRRSIEALGYDPKEVSYIVDTTLCSSTFDEPGSHWREMGIKGLFGGGAFGAVAGVVAGLGSIALLGPIGAIAGAATGGVVGLLLGAGLASDQAIACENAIKAGALLMVVQTHAGDSERVRRLLGDHVVADEKDEYR
jgi:hypothetical protein